MKTPGLIIALALIGAPLQALARCRDMATNCTLDKLITLHVVRTERVLPAAPVVYDAKTADCMRAIDQSKESERRLCTEPAPKLTVDADGFPIQDVEIVCRRVNAPSSINNRIGPPSQAAMNVCIDFVQPYYNSAKRYWNSASHEDRQACLSKAGDGDSYGFYTHLDQCF